MSADACCLQLVIPIIKALDYVELVLKSVHGVYSNQITKALDGLGRVPCFMPAAYDRSFTLRKALDYVELVLKSMHAV